MLISLVGILSQDRMGVGRVTFLSKGPVRVNMFSLRQNTYFLWTFSISVIISADSLSYCLKMIMLITLVGTLTQTRLDDFL